MTRPPLNNVGASVRARLNDYARQRGENAQLRDPQFDITGPGLPVALPVAIALGFAFRILLPVGRAGAYADLQLHQPLSGKSNHLFLSKSASALFSTSSRRSIIGLVIVGLHFVRLCVATQSYQKTGNGQPRCGPRPSAPCGKARTRPAALTSYTMSRDATFPTFPSGQSMFQNTRADYMKAGLSERVVNAPKLERQSAFHHHSELHVFRRSLEVAR
jgi:hypothetical protein